MIRPMTDAPLTDLLNRASAGEAAAREEAYDIVSARLHALAKRAFASERAGHTLQPTALVDDAYVELMANVDDWASRAQFFAMAASAIRRFLTDHARRVRAEKRGGGARPVTIETHMLEAQAPAVDPLLLDEALARLEAKSERCARVFECRFFAGLGNQEVAAALGLGLRTVEQDWAFARAWMRRHLGAES